MPRSTNGPTGYCSGNDIPHKGGGRSNGASGGGGASGGCVHPDDVIMDEGVTFMVRYTGCIEVKISMKSLNFETRTHVARECIHRVCEAAGLITQSKRRLDKKINQYLADRPCMENAGTNVIINVSSKSLNFIDVESGKTIANHEMPRISFASGGDSETLHFLGYIAKSEDDYRACYVLECVSAQTEELIGTIGQAFNLRYKAINKMTLAQSDNNVNYLKKSNEKDYYNDLPDKLPPDLLCDKDQLPKKVTQLNLKLKKPRDRLSSNLIDLNSPPADQNIRMDCNSELNFFNDNNGDNRCFPDVFDIQSFSLSAEVQRSQLVTETWFHGVISRQISESLLKQDGDFLVRESQGKNGQYVLSGLEGKTPKHLLLIDPEGVVRTKDRIFDSISHLINYHWANSLPIISEETELVLRNPVTYNAPPK